MGEGRLECELPKSLHKPLKKKTKTLLIRNYYFHPSSSLEIKELYFLEQKSEMMKILLEAKKKDLAAHLFYYCYDDSLLLSTYMALYSFKGFTILNYLILKYI